MDGDDHRSRGKEPHLFLETHLVRADGSKPSTVEQFLNFRLVDQQTAARPSARNEKALPIGIDLAKGNKRLRRNSHAQGEASPAGPGIAGTMRRSNCKTRALRQRNHLWAGIFSSSSVRCWKVDAIR